MVAPISPSVAVSSDRVALLKKEELVMGDSWAGIVSTLQHNVCKKKLLQSLIRKTWKYDLSCKQSEILHCYIDKINFICSDFYTMAIKQ